MWSDDVLKNELVRTYVPGPASYRTVDDGSPTESEDERWQYATALEGSANNELDSTGAKEHLIQAEHDLRKKC